MVSHNIIECPFCHKTATKTARSRYFAKEIIIKQYDKRNELQFFHFTARSNNRSLDELLAHSELATLIMFKCPNCGNTSIKVKLVGSDYGNGNQIINVFPRSTARPLPNYIPQQIREDYKEAWNIVDLSPKSSAMLSRRVLEEIITDYFHITRGKLIYKLKQLKHRIKDKHTWEAIDSIRRVGNVGAHGVQESTQIIDNITTKEAETLLKLIDLLIQKTYEEAHHNDEIENAVIKIADRHEPESYKNENHNKR